jgi:hypothetical protein
VHLAVQKKTETVGLLNVATVDVMQSARQRNLEVKMTCCAQNDQKKFGTVAVVLVSIIIMVGDSLGSTTRLIHGPAVGSSILIYGFGIHLLCLAVAVRDKATFPAIVIALFTGRWLFTGLMGIGVIINGGHTLQFNDFFTAVALTYVNFIHYFRAKDRTLFWTLLMLIITLLVFAFTPLASRDTMEVTRFFMVLVLGGFSLWAFCKMLLNVQRDVDPATQRRPWSFR